MTQLKRIEGRLAKRPFQEGDPLPAVGSTCLVSGANCDIESDQHRGYGWRQVIGYTDNKQFICLQTEGCWPTVERTENCWFAEIPEPLAEHSPSAQDEVPSKDIDTEALEVATSIMALVAMENTGGDVQTKAQIQELIADMLLEKRADYVRGVNAALGSETHMGEPAATTPSPAVAPEPVAYGAFYTGGKRAGKLYAHCDTKEQIDSYIADVHQRNDTITLHSGPLYLATPSPSLAVRDVVDEPPTKSDTSGLPG